eukprot:3027594-Pleurochrysis_carterae.AAC.1
MSRRALPHAAQLQAAQSVHGTDGHSAVAHGRDAEGRSRARAAAAYPPQMNAALADICSQGRWAAVTAQHDG